MIQNAIFVTGTDTGVGKTLVTALLALKIRHLGFDCGVFKPFASGCEWENGVLAASDAQWLQKILELDDSHDEICPIRLEEPLAPLIAARRAGISTREWPEIARQGFERLRAKHEWVVVEGVGGLLVPIWEEDGAIRTVEDLINAWSLSVVLVARRTLGTINHSFLSLSVPLKPPARFSGLIFNDAAPVASDDIAAQTSPEFISERAALPVWGQVPFVDPNDAAALQRVAITDIEIPASTAKPRFAA